MIYSRVQTIVIEGQQKVSKEEILDTISVHKGDVLLFVNTGHVEDEFHNYHLLKR